MSAGSAAFFSELLPASLCSSRVSIAELAAGVSLTAVSISLRARLASWDEEEVRKREERRGRNWDNALCS